MVLFLKKFLVATFSPLTVAVFLYLSGILFLIIGKRRKTPLILLLSGVSILLLSGYGIVNNRIVQIESQFIPLLNLSSLSQKPPGYIAVLGSGHVSDPKFPATVQINADSLFRVIEGVRIYRNLPGSKLILSGGPGFDAVPNAEVMAAVASDLGILKKDIVVEASPQNTEEEAIVIRRHVERAPFILVTSAMHMPRAMEIFMDHDMRPIPATTDFIFKSSASSDPKKFFPSTRNLALTERIIYEYLGKAWYHITKIFKDFGKSQTKPSVS